MRILFLLLLFVNTITNAQKFTISGKVNDTNFLPLAGASILVDNNKQGASSDNSGEFSLNLEKGNYKLIISYTGYTSVEKEIELTENKELVINLEEMISYSKNNSKIILDARSYKRFTGEAKEPRPGLQSGHIPNSRSLPSSELLTNDGFLKSIEELDKFFSNNDIDTSEDIVATCGSGVSACVISVALYCLGKEHIPIYDGSWTEWATSRQKIQTGN